jgi:hypothetical protein
LLLPKANNRLLGDFSPILVTLFKSRAKAMLSKSSGICRKKLLHFVDARSLFFVECNTLPKFAAYIQGCQMVYFQTQNPNLGRFWRALE